MQSQASFPAKGLTRRTSFCLSAEEHRERNLHHSRATEIRVLTRWPCLGQTARLDFKEIRHVVRDQWMLPHCFPKTEQKESCVVIAQCKFRRLWHLYWTTNFFKTINASFKTSPKKGFLIHEILHYLFHCLPLAAGGSSLLKRDSPSRVKVAWHLKLTPDLSLSSKLGTTEPWRLTLVCSEDIIHF